MMVTYEFDNKLTCSSKIVNFKVLSTSISTQHMDIYILFPYAIPGI